MPLCRSNFTRSRQSAASFFAASLLGNTKSETTSQRKARGAYSRENHRRRASTPDPPIQLSPSTVRRVPLHLASFCLRPHPSFAPAIHSRPSPTTCSDAIFCNEKSFFCSQKYPPNLGPWCHTLIRALQKHPGNQQQSTTYDTQALKSIIS